MKKEQDQSAIKKIGEWSIGSIVGNIACALFFPVVYAIIGYFNGSLATVIGFAEAHKAEAFMWCLMLVAVGIIIGFLIRHRMAIKQLATKDAELKEMADKRDSEIVAKDAEIAELKKRPTRALMDGAQCHKLKPLKARKLTKKEIAQVLNHLSVDWKALYKGACEKKFIYCDTQEWETLTGPTENPRDRLIEWENVEGDRTRLKATDELKDLLKASPALFDTISDDRIEDHGVYLASQEIQYRRGQAKGCPHWWWYLRDSD